MCMLSFFPAGVMPLQTEIKNGAEVNPDGHGFAIVTKQRSIIVQRDMNAQRLIERFMETRAEHLDGPALFHSRIATSGMVDITGCHPLRVGRDNRTVLAHNGVLFSPPKGSLQSDTAIFAERMLPRFGSFDSPRKFAKLEQWVRPSNKLVVLTVNPQRRKNAYIVNAESGYWAASGAWHSNSDYQGWKTTYIGGRSYSDSGWNYSTSYSDTEPWPCDVCGSLNCVDAHTLVCHVCHTCNDCHQSESDCLCYYGAQAYGKSWDNRSERLTATRQAIAISPATGCVTGKRNEKYGDTWCKTHDSYVDRDSATCDEALTGPTEPSRKPTAHSTSLALWNHD